MDTRNLLWVALFAVAFLLWNDWQIEHRSAEPSHGAAQQSTSLNTSQAATAASAVPPVKSINPQPSVVAVTSQKNQQQMVQVETDQLSVRLDRHGGNFVSTQLKKYPVTLGSTESVMLLSDDSNQYYGAHSGIVANTGGFSTQSLQFQANNQYILGNAQTMDVRLQANANQLEIVKTYHFHKGTYQVGVDYRIRNVGNAVFNGNVYADLLRKKPSEEQHGFFKINPFVGASIYSPEHRYQKIAFDHFAKDRLEKSIAGGWMAMQQHYFLTTWVPDPAEAFQYTTQALPDDMYLIRMLSPMFSLEPGKTKNITMKFYVGPESIEDLNTVAPGLQLTADYGIFWPISLSLFWMMKHIFNVVGNWGLSIIFVTCLIKLAFYQLSAKSYRSMARMRDLQPKILALQERYGADRQKLGQATMGLYRKEKVNPLGGCLPIIVQIPVFIALYWVLLESVELRQAPFFLWIRDLSAADPYYVLPILMGLTMWIQQKLSPPPPDPMQAKVMAFLPAIFTFFFLNFPSGLVLYWVVNSVLSIAQQWYINKTMRTHKTKVSRTLRKASAANE